MYTASIEQRAFKAAGKTAPDVLKKPLQRLQREWNALNRAQANTYQVYPDVPARVLSAAQNLIGAVTDHLADAPLSIDDTLLRAFFDAMHFVSLAEQFGEHSVFDVRLGGQRTTARAESASTLCVRNVVPAHFLAPRHATAHTSILFSGTLTPDPLYRDMLGLPDGTISIEV